MTTEKCKHRWVLVKDGTLDLLCKKCGMKAKQAVNIQRVDDLTLPTVAPAMQPIMRRETGIDFEKTAYKQINIV